MFRAILASLFIAITIAALPAEDQLSQLSADIIIVEDAAEFRAQHPELVFTPMKKQETKGQILYTLGSRLNGDRIVAQTSDSQQWSTPQNLQLSLKYPTSGEGSVVSYVKVIVNQSSNMGDGHVVDGGIGQRRITILIQAIYTTYFNYAAVIYGYN